MEPNRSCLREKLSKVDNSDPHDIASFGLHKILWFQVHWECGDKQTYFIVGHIEIST